MHVDGVKYPFFFLLLLLMYLYLQGLQTFFFTNIPFYVSRGYFIFS